METYFTAYVVQYASPDTPTQTRAFLKALDATGFLNSLAEGCNFLSLETEQVNGTLRANSRHGIYCVEYSSAAHCRREYFATMSLACRWVLETAEDFGWEVDSITEIYLVDGE